MNVPRPSGIEAGLDRPEKVFTRGSGQETPEALKVLIACCVTLARWMNISARIVRMPDLEMRIADRVAAAVEHSTAQVSDRANCGSDGAVDHQQVIVRVQRQRDRIIGAFGL